MHSALWKQLLKFTAVFCGALLVFSLAVPAAYSQTGSAGVVSVSVMDPAGAEIPDAVLQLKDLDTNVVQKAATQANGAFTFASVTFGRYELTVSKTGFETQVFGNLQVQTGRTTDIRAVLKIGATQQTVTVQGESPLVETDTSVLSDTIDTKQVVNLPLQGRNMFALAFLIPGWASTAPGSTGGTFDNMPGGAIGGAEFDGTQAISNRFRSGGFTYGTSVVQPRIEDVAEMTIQTAQLDLSGNGVASMKISLVTRRGTNAFHGRVFEDFQNTDLNANSWVNNARNLPRNIVKLNDFGFSVGGPIIKNRLFFFGTYAESIQPQSIIRERHRCSAPARRAASSNTRLRTEAFRASTCCRSAHRRVERERSIRRSRRSWGRSTGSWATAFSLRPQTLTFPLSTGNTRRGAPFIIRRCASITTLAIPCG